MLVLVFSSAKKTSMEWASASYVMVFWQLLGWKGECWSVKMAETKTGGNCADVWETFMITGLKVSYWTPYNLLQFEYFHYCPPKNSDEPVGFCSIWIFPSPSPKNQDKPQIKRFLFTVEWISGSTFQTVSWFTTKISRNKDSHHIHNLQS